MAVKIKLITKAQLAEFFKGIYRDAFPDWHVEHDVVLVRSHIWIKRPHRLLSTSCRLVSTIMQCPGPHAAEARLLTRFWITSSTERLSSRSCR